MKLYGEMAAVVALVIVGVTLMEVKESNAARILMAVPIGTRSHMNFFMPIAEHLVQRNHTVTYLSGYESSNKHPNIRVIFVPDIQIFNNMQQLFTTDSRTAMTSILDDMKRTCIKALAYEGVQRLVDEKFDLVILHIAFSECFLSFVHNLKIPFIFVNPNKVVGAYGPIAGTPAFPALLNSFFIDLEYPLTFTGRMISTLYDILLMTTYDWFVISSQDAECRSQKLCPEDMPSLQELRLNSSLFITNSVKTMETPTMPYTPTVVHAGGIHCRPAKPLPEDLQQWVTASGKSGFIFFSLGSLVKPSTMPEKYRKVLVKVFGSLQQRVLWKYDEETMEGLPPNVRISKWLPQQDLLGHPQLRLFITHGGLFSTQEAIYHGVPVLGMPVSLDQHQNMRMVQWEGWGRVIYWEDLTCDILRSYILQVMDDSSLQEEVHRRSIIMRDQPVSPGDWTNYWVEYVLRHEGAINLRSPAARLPWYQLYNVDVWSLLLVMTVVTLILSCWICFKIFLAIVRCCYGSRKSKRD